MASASYRPSRAPLVVNAGPTIPLEPFWAAGCRVEVVEGIPGGSTEAGDRYMEDGLEVTVRSVFDQFVRGTWDEADLIVLDRSYRDVYYYLKELVRLGLAPGLPKLHLFDLLLTRDLPVQRYNAGQVEMLVEAVEYASDRRLERAELQNALVRSDEVRAQYRQLNEQRRRGVILGSEALRHIAVIRAADPSYQVLELQALNASLEERVPVDRPRLLLVTGDTSDVLALHHAAEKAGANIVAEDYRWGSRTAVAAHIEDADPVAAIAATAHRDGNGPELTPFSARIRWALEAGAEQIDGAVLHVSPNDRVLGWYLPELCAALKELGVPVLNLVEDAQSSESGIALHDAIRTWLGPAMMPGTRLKEVS